MDYKHVSSLLQRYIFTYLTKLVFHPITKLVQTLCKRRANILKNGILCKFLQSLGHCVSVDTRIFYVVTDATVFLLSVQYYLFCQLYEMEKRKQEELLETVAKLKKLAAEIKNNENHVRNL